MSLRWSYGVTTVPSRRTTLLPGTLASLAAGGFGDPRIFVDATATADVMRGRPVVHRESSVTPFGNWILALWELYVREPSADRFAIFQDDIVLYRNTRQYLNACEYPDGRDGRGQGYWNLITFTEANEMLVGEGTSVGWREGCLLNPPGTQQAGRGAVALVFSREAVQTLLSSPRIAVHPTARLGHRKIDGAVVEAMNAAGYREYVHGPSLVQHLGGETSIEGNPRHDLARTFRGEAFDAMELLGAAGATVPAVAAVATEAVTNGG